MKLGLGRSAIALVATSSLAVGSAAIAQSTPTQTGDRQTTQGETTSPPSPDAKRADAMSKQIVVETASDIVGQPLLDQNGERLGEIEYMLVNPVSGKVSFVVVGRGGTLDLGEKLLPVPWGHLDVVPGDTNATPRVTLVKDAPSLARVPQISQQELGQLTDPTFVTRIISFYGEPKGESGATSGGVSDDEPPVGSRTATGANQQSPTPEGQQAQSPTGEDRADATASGASTNTEQGKQAAGNVENNALVVGRVFITTLGPPLTQWRSNISGAEVTDREGRAIGEIDQLMIDTERGQVAYAILSQGGYLGFGETLKPIPLQALTWRGEGEFAANFAERKLDAVPPLTKALGEGFPVSVRRGDVEALYDRFNVKPYWPT